MKEIRDQLQFNGKLSKSSIYSNIKTINPEIHRSMDSYLEDAAAQAEFSNKKWVWVKDVEKAFIKGWVVKEEGDCLHVRCLDDSDRIVKINDVDRVNPPKFDKVDDMAELTYLNEASVVNNLNLRYSSRLIYTYSGLFLVAVNPYKPLPIYTDDYINMYRNSKRCDSKPHIYAITDLAFHNMLEMRENQSILITGESGAGKTENTKKVIQYLTAVATSQSNKHNLKNLERKILQANYILEAFGNAQTIRNNNSSRFGKFIRIEFNSKGQISGANIDWYLLEKSRVTQQNASERNYHIFYQLLAGASKELKKKLFLENSINNFVFLKNGAKSIDGVDDAFNFSLLKAKDEQYNILKLIASILHLGNLKVVSDRSEQAKLLNLDQVERLCYLLGIPVSEFTKALLCPKVKAGREWVANARSSQQVIYSLEALAKSLYERAFGNLVEKINSTMDKNSTKMHFIGVLDIAGFEIFQVNSFEQLCINYTNEKLQQFFNHHMFILEQEEYARENIDWKFIDFGHDLQPTIDLIEKTNPIGVLSCLDEECVIPKGTDKTFTEKLDYIWRDKSPKYKPSKFSGEAFILKHYAADVEYSTTGWLDKNKDPLNENIARILAYSNDKYIANLFLDFSEDIDLSPRKTIVKKGLFRTVAQRHKEQLASLIKQLESTQAHFVRCILPNQFKKPFIFNCPLVLDQLRCNGVLEGIRIARTGFPNRLLFSEFRQRYGVLTPCLSNDYMDGRKTVKLMLEKLDIDISNYKIGLSKVFFKAGILAELEDRRDFCLQNIFTQLQAISKGYIQRKIISKKFFRYNATCIIQKNLMIYLDLCQSPWWKLFFKMKPLLNATFIDDQLRKKNEEIENLSKIIKNEALTKKKLLLEKQTAEEQKLKLEETLQNERALALDKEEILKRTQEREAKLSEQLRDAIEDLDRLEAQCDDLLAVKKKVDIQAEKWRIELQNGSILISKLEEEKRDLINHIRDLEAKNNILSEKCLSANDAEKYESRIKCLETSLSKKELKIAQFNKKIEDETLKIEISFREKLKNYEFLQEQEKKYKKENEKLSIQLNEMSTNTISLETFIQKKESEVIHLRNDISELISEKDQLKQELIASSVKNDTFKSEIINLTKEIQELKIAKQKAENDAIETQNVLHKKMSQDAKANDIKNMLERQLLELKEELESVHEELKLERQSNIDYIEKSSSETAKLKLDNQNLFKYKEKTEEEFQKLKQDFQKISEEYSESEKTKKSIMNEVTLLRRRALNAELAQDEIEKNRISLNQQLADITSKANIAISNLEDSNNAKTKLISDISLLKLKIEDLESEKTNLQRSLKHSEQEVQNLTSRVDIEQKNRLQVEKNLTTSNSELLKLQTHIVDIVNEKLQDIKKEKSSIESEIKLWKSKYEDNIAFTEELQKQKQRITMEAEDLEHELEREHQISKSAEKMVANLKLQLNETKTSLQTEKQQSIINHNNSIKFQKRFQDAHKEILECRKQLLSFQEALRSNKVISPDHKSDIDTQKLTKLAKQLDKVQSALIISEESKTLIEKQFNEARKQWNNELSAQEAKYMESHQNLLDELSQPIIIPSHQSTLSSSIFQKETKNIFTSSKIENTKTDRLIKEYEAHAHTIDGKENEEPFYLDRRTIQALESEIESLETRLDMSEKQKKQLETKLEFYHSTQLNGSLDMKRLKRENDRLHELLNDNADQLITLEKIQKNGIMTIKDFQSKSLEELEESFNSIAESRKSLLLEQKETLVELESARKEVEQLRKSQSNLQHEYYLLQEKLKEYEFSDENEERLELIRELAEIQMRFEIENQRSTELSESLTLYKNRAEEYFNKLETAEINVIKASRSETFARSQLKDAEETISKMLEERKEMEEHFHSLQKQIRELEAKIEDSSVEILETNMSRQRVEQELEIYKGRRQKELEDREYFLEQTRKKYQRELSGISNELQIERENSIQVLSENKQLRETLEKLQLNWDTEVLNNSSWEREKTRLESSVQDLTKAYQEAIDAQQETQEQVISLFSQIRSMRISMDELEVEKSQLQKDKKALELKINEISSQLNVAERSQGISDRTNSIKDVNLLKAAIAEKENIVNLALEKMKRAENLAHEVQKEIAIERETNMKLYEEKALLEKEKMSLQIKLVNMETKLYSSNDENEDFLLKKIKELEDELSKRDLMLNKENKTMRFNDRSIKDLQYELSQRDRTKERLENELIKSNEKIQKLKKIVDELQSSESTSQLAARRAEREARDEREKSLRLEKELEKAKSRIETASIINKNNTIKSLNSLSSKSSPSRSDTNNTRSTESIL
ncbi:uncharacterized protein T551_01540 [Pneumocystis jirovecii RU7]|uniref:Myosin motor domain-containing protein n=1 Tax=Pneumocystis jirovecii (strain RU7) TaxID=1408657 RepID=A0A0W4ZRJ1_PNEJ7|nr:uncharacterized protein T551_01540 [Pneumocystis jirovecii RU7]KTW30988.1 hypothetical protein T551_01540 [Pneumocystis jirovecii RU7]